MVLDRTDPAFADAISIPLPPAGLAAGVTTFQIVSGGTTIGLLSTNGGLLATGSFAPGVVVRTFGPGQGVTVSVSPQTTAIGFTASQIDGCPGGTFFGAAQTQQANQICGTNRFFGAADIGLIGAVQLEQSGSLWKITEILVVQGTPSGPGSADLGAAKTASTPRVIDGEDVSWGIDVTNAGPNPALGARLIDLLPPPTYLGSTPSAGYDFENHVLHWPLGDLSPGTSHFAIRTHVEPLAMSCDERFLNVAIVSSPTADAALTNNVAVSSVGFDKERVAGNAEFCGNGLDDNCDGLVDCTDPGCGCFPVLPSAPGGDPSCHVDLIQPDPTQPPIIVGNCSPENTPAPQHECRVSRGTCGNVSVPSYCCDPSSWSNPSNNASQAIGQCDLGVSGCVPHDPNFKESDPTVNLNGYGLASAGQLITYRIHYENDGNADALQVKIIDELDSDLDASTLVIDDGGVYDPNTRVIVWTDPVVPPLDPRFVTFRARVRADAPPATHVRNVGTIVFPNADPPSRTDTDFVDHVIVSPTHPPVPRLAVTKCVRASASTWKVFVTNTGGGFAYNVTASVVSPPAGVTSSGSATFRHKDDALPALSTVIPGATTESTNALALQAPGSADPCPYLHWQLAWEDLQGARQSQTVQYAPLPCDFDADGDVDRVDTAAITAARNQNASGPQDPRDVDHDGRITVLDARTCATRCTRPLCATQ